MNDEILQYIQQVYGVENWSSGYFDINSKGHIIVRPGKDDPRFVDLKDLVDDLLANRKLQLPLLIRFPQLLTGQLRSCRRRTSQRLQNTDIAACITPSFR